MAEFTPNELQQLAAQPEEVGQVPQQAPENQVPKQLRYGITVGVDTNSEFVFEMVGEQMGVVELMGLVKYAEYKAQVVTDINQSYGPPAIMEAIKLLIRQNSQLLGAVNTLATGVTSGGCCTGACNEKPVVQEAEQLELPATK